MVPIPWYRLAAVGDRPLAFRGAGLKFKVVDQAMTYGLPVVGTPVAADGYREGELDRRRWSESPRSRVPSYPIVLLLDGFRARPDGLKSSRCLGGSGVRLGTGP